MRTLTAAPQSAAVLLVLATSAVKDPKEDRKHQGDDDTRHDGEVEAESLSDYMNVPRQAAKWNL